MIVYVKTQGARIVKEGRHLVVKKGDGIYNTLFTYKLKQLLLFGNIEITHSALCQLMRHNIDTVFLTHYGRYLGRLELPESKNVFLHKKQYLLLGDFDFGLRTARSIVFGKLTNMATLLLRIKRTRKQPVPGVLAGRIQNLLPKLANAGNLDSIRGYEGRGSAIFFEGLCYGFVDSNNFHKRVRRPPTDPVNSVLSLLYTFLMNRVYTAIRITGLDPYPGFLHALDYGRYSLVLDLMEEFRTIIVDTLTLSLFNLKILQKDDFYIEKPVQKLHNNKSKTDNIADVTKDPIGLISMDETKLPDEFDLPEQRIDHTLETSPNITGKYPVKLKKDAFRRVIDAFEKKISSSFYHPLAERKLTFFDSIIFQAGLYRKLIEGEVDVYQPVLLK